MNCKRRKKTSSEGQVNLSGEKSLACKKRFSKRGKTVKGREGNKGDGQSAYSLGWVGSGRVSEKISIEGRGTISTGGVQKPSRRTHGRVGR